MKKTVVFYFLYVVLAITLNAQKKPAWVDKPSSVYPDKLYVSAVGGGRDRAAAENSAKAALVSYFKQSITSQVTIVDREQQAGGRTVSSTSDMAQSIEAVAALDTLIGVEIKATWDGGKTGWWAMAVMEKAQAAPLYKEMIQENIRIINNILTISESEKNSLEGYSRYQLAATLADTNEIYYQMLFIMGMADGIAPGKNGGSYRIEAAEIAQRIPVLIKVTGDRNDRIKIAFAEALNKAGFRSGDSNSRYVLNVVLNFAPVESSGQNKYVRYSVEARLVDQRQGGAVLFPFSISGRGGHRTLEEAENRALIAIIREIDETYGSDLLVALAKLVKN